MTFEVEVRSLFSSVEEFEACKQQVVQHAVFKERHSYRTFLFRQPDFLRIRIRKGSSDAVITQKSGSYDDLGREEREKKVPRSELSQVLSQLKEQGYMQCVVLDATSDVFLMNDAKVAFNEIDFLGCIVEVEMLTDEEEDVPKLHSQVTQLLHSLGLTMLDSKEYASMIEDMYKQLLKPIDDNDFNFDNQAHRKH